MPRSEPYCGVLAAVAACAGLLATLGCGGRSETEVIGPDQVRCATAISSTSALVPGDGGRVSITIDAARECEWEVTTDASWLQLSSTRGQGAGTLVITALPNTLPGTRSARVQINDQQLSVTQEASPCRFELRPSSVQVAPRGGAGTVAVTTADTCVWQASTSASWVTLSDASQTGPGSFTYDVDPLDGGPRDAVVRVANQVFTISQSEAEPAPSPAPPPPPSSSALPAPRGLSARVVSDTRVDLSWTSADPSAQTQVFRNGALVATKEAGATTHQDSGLTRTTDYTYVVRHMKGGIEGADSNSASARPAFFATGGSISSSGGYRQHLFTSSGSFVVTHGGAIDEIIIIGGGGGGGGSEAGTEWGSGGGGAGGVRVITMKVESPGTYSVVVGTGGGGGGSASSRPGNNNGRLGGSSSYGSETAQGGGGGAGAGSNEPANPGNPGGSGGGGVAAAGGGGTSGQGNAGGAGFFNRGGAAGGGGGGGKGGPGSAANGGQGGNGGPGFPTWIGTVASGGKGGRLAGVGGSGSAPGDGGQGNGPGGGGGAGTNGAVLIRYRQ